jgi:hypothetical protein
MYKKHSLCTCVIQEKEINKLDRRLSRMYTMADRFVTDESEREAIKTSLDVRPSLFYLPFSFLYLSFSLSLSLPPPHIILSPNFLFFVNKFSHL